eukprot:13949-Hanusia_phi.AAC.1
MRKDPVVTVPLPDSARSRAGSDPESLPWQLSPGVGGRTGPGRRAVSLGGRGSPTQPQSGSVRAGGHPGTPGAGPPGY